MVVLLLELQKFPQLASIRKKELFARLGPFVLMHLLACRISCVRGFLTTILLVCVGFYLPALQKRTSSSRLSMKTLGVTRIWFPPMRHLRFAAPRQPPLNLSSLPSPRPHRPVLAPRCKGLPARGQHRPPLPLEHPLCRPKSDRKAVPSRSPRSPSSPGDGDEMTFHVRPASTTI